jgi:hypothetical protein
LPQLGHPYVALGSVVIGRRPEVGGEAQVVVLAAEQAAGQPVVLFHRRPGAGGSLAGPGQDGATPKSGPVKAAAHMPPGGQGLWLRMAAGKQPRYA